MRFILKCPCCENKDYLKHRGNTFHCTDCDNEYDLEEMDFEELED
jgi:hypothetical protein|nr:MAG TPA: Trm112p-like protein [Caudoviricetes sp.]